MMIRISNNELYYKQSNKTSIHEVVFDGAPSDPLKNFPNEI